MKNSTLIIPAAGSGSRLNSTAPKIFTPVYKSKTIFDLITEQAAGLFDTIQLILSPEGVRYLENSSTQLPTHLNIVVQEKPTGMFDAIDLAMNQPEVSNHVEKVVIQWGDQPFIDPLLYSQLLNDLESFGSSIPLIWTQNPYVQFRFSAGDISILESREGDSCDKAGFKDIGIFSFRYEPLIQVWDKYKQMELNGKVTGEKSFLKLIPHFRQNHSIHWRLDQPSYKGMGINTPEELSETDLFMKQMDQLKSDER